MLKDEFLISSLHRNLWIYSLWILLASFLTLYLKDIIWLALAALSGCAYWVFLYYKKDNSITFPHGPANAITILRLCLLISVSIMHPGISLFWLGTLYTIICLGDIIDGRIARALNMTSIIGEYLDKETDALFVLLSTIVLYMHHIAGVWIVSLGLIRYIYFLIMFFYMKDDKKESKNPSARIIAVIVFVSILSAFFVPVPFAPYILALAGILLTFSFGKSVISELRLTNI